MRYKVLVILILCAGCLPASQQEVIDLTNTVNQIVPAVREAVSASSEETRDKVEIVLGQVEEVNEAVATAEDPVEAVEKGWKASEPFNPYYGYGAAALALLKLFTDTKKKKEIENKYSAAKVGMDKFRNENPDKAAELYNDVGEARKAKKIA
jgi:hypothetical protein